MMAPKFKSIIIESLKGSQGTTSSKRIVGVPAGYVTLFLILVGALYSLKCKEWDVFVELCILSGSFTGVLLGAGLFEKPSKSPLNAPTIKTVKSKKLKPSINTIET